ncbi:MAG: hypothetical protein Q8P56_06685 [Candidatus Uhrbacteria bacterium]|nr:hypothetical protein [Candidatus Uhrbacteria bacterium]
MTFLQFKNIRSYWRNRIIPPHLWREVLCVFFSAAAFFALLGSIATFPDPDSFYHARIAIMMTQGPVLSFPWLPLTSLADTFIDHHFLYHILLIPFVVLGDPLVGLKVATLFFAACFVALFYWILRAGRIRDPLSRTNALLFVCILLLNTGLTFRINLAKIPAVSLFVFFCGIWAVCQKNLKALFGISFLFVWLYGGWPLMPMMALLAWIALSATSLPDSAKLSLISFVRSPDRFRYGKKCLFSFFQSLLHREHVALPLASFAGSVAGLVINPYFPTNIQFYWVQTIKIAVLNIISDIPVGSEWYPPGMTFIPTHGPTLMILVFALCIFFLPELFSSLLKISLPKRRWQDWLLCMLTILFAILTLKSRRYGEYFAPLATLFSAYSISPVLRKDQWTRFWHLLKRNVGNLASPRGLATGYLIVMIPAIITTNLIQIFSIFRGGYSFAQYTRGMAWLEQNTPGNSLVFHNRWDDFPLFFYHNRHNRYISGLDARFLLETNKPLAEEYAIMEQGKDMTDLYGYRPLCLATREVTRDKKGSDTDISLPASCIPIKEKDALTEALKSFGSNIIVLTHLEDAQTKKIRELPGLEELYRDDEIVILSL